MYQPPQEPSSQYSQPGQEQPYGQYAPQTGPEAGYRPQQPVYGQPAPGQPMYGQQPAYGQYQQQVPPYGQPMPPYAQAQQPYQQINIQVGAPGVGVMAPQKSWVVTLLLCIFLGYLGIHRFYTGHVAIGLIQLFTAGGCGIWTLVDFIMLLTNSYNDSYGRPLLR